MENNDIKLYKVYGMLLEVKETLFLSIQYATSLEEAFNQAKLEFHRLNPIGPGIDNSLFGVKIGLFSVKNIDQIIHEHDSYSDRQLQKIALKHQKAEKQEIKEEIKKEKKPVEIKKVELDPKAIKNIIMREIIFRKDKDMFEEHKGIFDKNETQYLKDKLENNIK